jgi:putative acetyltransferase
VRAEEPGDAAAIEAATRAAFAASPHGYGGEAGIVDVLREAGALSLSLVAVQDGEIVGHAAFSPVEIEGCGGGWFGLGPVSVLPDRRRRGIGAALIRTGLEQLRETGAHGCVVVGDPAYYGRFGFASEPGLGYGGLDPRYVMRLFFTVPAPPGAIRYHRAFGGG